MTLGTVELRPATPADEPFLRRLFADTRRGASPGDTDDQVDPLLLLRYHAHSADRRSRHPRAQTAIITDAGVAVGTMTVDRGHERLHLVDIAVLSSHRGRGIASDVLARLIGDGHPVTLSVWGRNHAALRLYERHGFAVVAEQFGYLLMATDADG